MPSFNVLAVCKKGSREKYVFIYDDASKSEMLRQLVRFAKDPELDFSWADAKILKDKMRHLEQS